jgi:hypothetical protein
MTVRGESPFKRSSAAVLLDVVTQQGQRAAFVSQHNLQEQEQR